MKGWILDIYPDIKKGKMVIWFRAKKHCYKIQVDYDPVFYMKSDKKGLRQAEEYYEKKDFRTERVRRITDLYSRKEEELLKVYPGKVFDPRDQLQAFKFFKGFKDKEFYNVDIPLDQRYLIEKELKPMSILKKKGGWIDLEDERVIDYSKPDLRTIYLGVSTEGKKSKRRKESRLKALTLDDETLNKDEVSLLQRLNRELKRRDPDVILTRGGDEFLIPYLAHRTELNEVSLKLGREAALHPPKEDTWYESYGRVVYRPPSYPLKGRIHIDMENSFLYKKGGLDGLIEASRLSRVPIQRLCRRSPGSLINAMEVKEALKNDYLIPWKKNLSEDFKSTIDLLKADRGGHILEPKVGIHEEVIKLDFASMYPSIIDKYNLSPETLECTCGEDRKVPELDYFVCKKEDGIIPKVVKPLIRRRQEYKKLSKKSERFEKRADMLKWLLVTCFGYTGYKKARFNCIEVHESITAYAREIFLDAVDTAQKMDFEVLHGIVDSLWLKGEEDKVSSLIEKVGEKTRLELEEEGIYSWIAFLPRLSDGIGVPNRYYGILEDEIEMKGIAAVRADTPRFFKGLQETLLDNMKEAETESELTQMIEELLDIIRSGWIQLRSREVEPDKLLFTKTASKRAEEYLTVNEIKSALYQYKDMGFRRKPGKTVTFLVTDSKSKDENEKVKIGLKELSSQDYDIEYYEDTLFRISEEILIALGYDRDKIEKKVKRSRT